jgi:fatty acid desaturase
LGWGGFGLIAKTVFNAIRWSDRVPSLHSMLLLDSVGILFMQICLLSIAIFNHCLGLYFLFWLILERVIGAIMQARDHLEHYGLWSRVPSHQLTQLYASRNLTTSSWIAWCMGGLNHHAVHHAFPNLPFNHLPEAFNRIQTVLAQYDLPPMSIGDGYVRETLHLGTQPSLIGEAQPHHAVGRYTMKAL